MNGLGNAPPHCVVQFGGDHEIGEDEVFDQCAISVEQADAAVAMRNDTVAESGIANGFGTFRLDFDAGGTGGERAARHGDVFAGPKLGEVAGSLQDDAVVTGLDVAVGDADAAAVVDINAIAVRDAEIVEDADALDVKSVASDRVNSPGRSVDDGELFEADIAAIQEKQHAGSPIGRIAMAGRIKRIVRTEERLSNFVAAFAKLGEIGVEISINLARAANGNVRGVLGEEKRTVLMEEVAVTCGFECGPGAEFEGDVRPQDNTAAQVSFAAGQKNGSTSGCGAGIHRSLEGGCVIR